MARFYHMREAETRTLTEADIAGEHISRGNCAQRARDAFEQCESLSELLVRHHMRPLLFQPEKMPCTSFYRPHTGRRNLLSLAMYGYEHPAHEHGNVDVVGRLVSRGACRTAGNPRRLNGRPDESSGSGARAHIGELIEACEKRRVRAVRQ